eukprot:gene23425-30706_t
MGCGGGAIGGSLSGFVFGGLGAVVVAVIVCSVICTPGSPELYSHGTAASDPANSDKTPQIPPLQFLSDVWSAASPADAGERNTILDEEIVATTVRLGFERDMLVESIKTKQQNKATVAYYLMRDNRRQMTASEDYLTSDFNESVIALLPPSSKRQMTASGDYLTSDCNESMIAMPPSGAPSSQGGPTSYSSPALQHRVVAERKWRLGTHSCGHPSTLMAELYRVLASLGVCWKKTAPYNLKCLSAAHTRQLPRPTHVQHKSGGEEDRSGDMVIEGVGGGSTLRVEGTSRGGEEDRSGAMVMEGVSGARTWSGRNQQGCGVVISEDPSVIKFECQVYKVRDDEYLVDIQDPSIIKFKCQEYNQDD